jgi:DNA-binding response OmpR family regulator
VAKVLIIEDDDVIAQGMARHLTAAGFDAVGVANGETGLARLRYEQPDVCVLDLMLPGIDGWRVIEQARRSSSSAHAAPSTTGSTRSSWGRTTTSSSRSL